MSAPAPALANPATAPRTPTRRRAPAIVRHSLALAGRSLTSTRRTPEALIDVTLQPILFLTIFTYVLGGAISGGSQHDYLQFLLPGILGQSIALGGIGIGSNLASDLEKGVFDRFRSLPIPRAAPLVGMVLADVVRYLVLTTVLLVFGTIIGFRITTGVPEVALAVALAVAFALCFCWISVWIGTKARTAASVQGISMLIVLPLSFGSSVFAPSDTMPGWLRAFVDVNPITQLVGAVRGLLVGGPVGDHVLWTLVWMAGLLAVFVPLALRGYAKQA